MRVTPPGGAPIDLGVVETRPTIGIVDYSRRVTDDFGVTTVIRRDFSRTISVRMSVPNEAVDALQRRLAGLRAVPAVWTADARFDWLSVTGFYSDFAIDLRTASHAFCTLTIEGLAGREAAVDFVVDPAPDGAASTLRLIEPADIVPAALIASNVAENDAPFWSAGTTYAVGGRVIRGTRVYESVIANNVGADPAADPTRWLDVGATNRWAMFDQALGSETIRPGDVSVTLRAGTVNAVAVFDVTGATVRVQAGTYSRARPVTGGTIVFDDLPTSDRDVVVTVSGPGEVAVGTLLIGRMVGLGVTEAAPTAGITDYSRKDVDDFGVVTVVERAWAKRMSVRGVIATDALDIVADRIAAVRGRPVLWIGAGGLDVLSIYGFFRDFSIELGESTSRLTVEVEGLSKAAPIAPPPPASVVAQGSADGVNWHPGLEAGDVFLRISTDSGATFGPAVRIVGENGEAGIDGRYQQQVFRRAATRPETPVGNGVPPGWSDGAPDADGELVWMSVQYQRNGISLGPWSVPARITGEPGPPGTDSFTLSNVANTVVDAGRVTKVSGGRNAWNAKAATLEAYPRAAAMSADCALATGIGLTTDPVVDAGWESVDYWMFATDAGSAAQVYTNGTFRGSFACPPPPVRLAVVADGITVRYLNGTTTLFEHPQNPADDGLHGVVTIRDQGEAVENSAFQPAGRAGASGMGGLTALLTNDTHQLPADPDGTVLSYVGAGSAFRIFEGSAPLTDGWTLSVGANPQALAVAIDGLSFAVTGGLDANEDRAELTIRALGSGRFAGVTLDKIFSLSKSKGGANAKLISVTSTHDTISLNKAGAVVPQTTTLLAARQNSTSRPVWRMFDGDGGGRTSYLFADAFAAAIDALAVSDDEIEITAAQLLALMNDGPNGPQNALIFEAAFDDGRNVSDRRGIVKVQDGADGVSPVAIEVTPTSHQVSASYDGVPAPGALPRFTTVRATRAGQPAVVVISALAATGCAATVVDGPDGSKAIRIDAQENGVLAATGAATFTATAGGQSASYRVAVEKRNAAAPVSGGGGGGGGGSGGGVEPGTVSQLYVNAPVGTSAYNQIGSTRAFTPGASGTMRFSFEGLYEAQLVTGQISTAAITAKLQYRVGDGPWIDVPDSETAGGFASRDGREQQSYEQISDLNSPGYLSSGAVDVSGIGGAGQARLLARLTGGNTTAVLDATATIEVR